ncbi:ATP-binding protein [Pseudoduganella sp. GCM10020061]|uniref:ATP-binding protein n=1 Tax=Pseudoduganella sp. GCM10020061 TaxID=3317345 RepID=UPI00362A9EA9
MSFRILTLAIHSELDVVASRQRARQVASLCGFGMQDQARLATAVSELARNVYNYAGSGRAEFSIEGETSPQLLVIRIEDKGRGIANLDLVLSGRYQSPTGMGLGIIGARRLVDQFDIQSAPGMGTTITLKKLLPADAPRMTNSLLGDIGSRLASLPVDVTLAEVQQQNRELLGTLAELKTRQEELMQLTRELEDTNRGVVALYAELDEKADHLRRADEMKSRFLSNMSHEFRTPLSSIRALSRLLLERVDGDLTPEQEKQVRFILKGAESLSELVDDLLDLAKIEAGKIEIRPVEFEVDDLFSALRGMLRPLLVATTVELVFDPVEPGLVMYTDEAKLSQILRNFISNALKFTEAGEVRISARRTRDGLVAFSVRDTGVGIAAEHQQLVFEEFSQVENRLQRRVKGTGLGLPLCRKLAGLLGGRVELVSSLGAGSTFTALLPQQYRDGDEPAALPDEEPRTERGIPVLVVEDDKGTAQLYKRYFADSPYRAVLARSVYEAEQMWQTAAPAAVLLDLYLNGEDSWRWLARVKNSEQRREVPVIIVSEVADQEKGFALGADAYFVKPVAREELLAAIDRLVAATPESKG